MTKPAQRQWKPFPLVNPRSYMRKGGIQLPPDPQACSDKTAKILRGSPTNGNGK